MRPAASHVLYTFPEIQSNFLSKQDKERVNLLEKPYVKTLERTPRIPAFDNSTDYGVKVITKFSAVPSNCEGCTKQLQTSKQTHPVSSTLD